MTHKRFLIAQAKCEKEDKNPKGYYFFLIMGSISKLEWEPMNVKIEKYSILIPITINQQGVYLRKFKHQWRKLNPENIGL